MTPLVPPPPQQHQDSAGQRTIALLVGFLAGLIVVGGLAALFVTRAYKQAAEGWQLKPVVVAAVDIEANAEITMELISQRSIPEQFLAGDEVLPADASTIIGKRSFLPLQAGDPLRHSYFAIAGVDGCLESVQAIVERLGTSAQPGVAALLEALAKTRPKSKEP